MFYVCGLWYIFLIKQSHYFFTGLMPQSWKKRVVLICEEASDIAFSPKGLRYGPLGYCSVYVSLSVSSLLNIVLLPNYEHIVHRSEAYAVPPQVCNLKSSRYQVSKDKPVFLTSQGPQPCAALLLWCWLRHRSTGEWQLGTAFETAWVRAAICDFTSQDSLFL